MVFQKPRIRTVFLMSTATAFLAGCSMDNMKNLDFDLRGNQYDTSEAVEKAMQKRPKPDSRGVISYPTYQVVVAKRGETVGSIAQRLGLNPESLAKYNGLRQDEKLSDGVIVALPSKVQATEALEAPAPVTTTSAAQDAVDVTALAQSAIDAADDSPAKAAPVTQPTKASIKSDPKIEPIRHKVARGETAFTIARLYDVTVRSLADWNSLDANFTVREGQYLLIPLPADAGAAPAAATAAVSAPGTGSATPVPPSATKALPSPETKEQASAKPAEAKATTVATPSGGRMTYPAQGKIIREYVKGKTDGIDISAPVGSSIVAADAGTVAAITADANQVPIVVVKHPNNILTVYANIGDITVSKGASVSRGQTLGKVRDGNPSYVHFEVRNGFESVDPLTYLK